MDLEGSEMKALKGAENIIEKNMPKLGISIYHSNQDMIDIPEYLMKRYPKYKFYIRQHVKFTNTETVLYATL